MSKAIVIGCPGSGKSTFAARYAGLTGDKLYHLDAIWHKPDRTHTSREEFDAILSDILETDDFVIDGNYRRTLGMRLEKCDTVFMFDLPTEACLQGAAERIGRPRPDMPWIETDFDPEFRKFIEDFRDNDLPKEYALLDKYASGRSVTIFYSREQADAYLNALAASV